ncbi:NDP-sugar synthase [Pelagibacteraceae bacterium]|nr:NDP-sugar synthase [Pelagibacteraceae bacterium]
MKKNIKNKNTLKTAIILCGGKGTRLGSLGKKIPKTLVKIQGKEILWYIIKTLKLYNFNHFIIPLGYKGSLIKKFFIRNKDLNSNVTLINTGINTNIGKRISQSVNQIKSDNFLLLNGDAIFDFNVEKIFNKHTKKNLGISFISGEITYQYGTVGILDGKVVDFKRNIIYESLKTRKSKKYTAFNYTGMCIIKKDLINKYKKKCENSKNFEQEIFPKFISSSNSDMFKINGFWHSVDNVKDIQAVNEIKLKDKRFIYIKKIKNKLNIFNNAQN